jgi:hypothetical protein
MTTKQPETIAELESGDAVRFSPGNGYGRIIGIVQAVRTDDSGRLTFEVTAGKTRYVVKPDEIKTWARPAASLGRGAV